MAFCRPSQAGFAGQLDGQPLCGTSAGAEIGDVLRPLLDELAPELLRLPAV
jgi:hypothetical protein